jgi:hypothetical protein
VQKALGEQEERRAARFDVAVATAEKLGDRKLDLTNADRRRLAVLGKELSRKLLAKVATIAAPDTILRWHRELVAKKYDGRKQRGPGRPRKAEELVELVLKMARENFSTRQRFEG